MLDDSNGAAAASLDGRVRPGHDSIKSGDNTVYAQDVAPPTASVEWAPDAEKELKKIPFFVRGKARRNTETFAADRGITHITIETIYDAKAHFSR